MEGFKPYNTEGGENTAQKSDSEKKGWGWPIEGKWQTRYEFFMMGHCLYYQWYVVARVAFENAKPREIIIFIDYYMNVVYLIDMVRCFLQPFVKEGRTTTNRRSIVFNYLTGWFWLDLYAFYPLPLMKAINYNISYDEKADSIFGLFIQQNFRRLQRVYMLMLLFQVFRGRNFMKYFVSYLKRKKLRIEYQSILLTMLSLMFILHVTGCLWYAASQLNPNDYTNWVTSNSMKDENMLNKYAASIYWATVTCTTVGYGDITPTNFYELIWALCIIMFGVAFFSYVLSDLSSKFTEITKSNALNQERMQQIDSLDQRF
jgi:hypothetical protein